jgi:hypothetical protein
MFLFYEITDCHPGINVVFCCLCGHGGVSILRQGIGVERLLLILYELLFNSVESIEL